MSTMTAGGSYSGQRSRQPSSGSQVTLPPISTLLTSFAREEPQPVHARDYRSSEGAPEGREPPPANDDYHHRSYQHGTKLSGSSNATNSNRHPLDPPLPVLSESSSYMGKGNGVIMQELRKPPPTPNLSWSAGGEARSRGSSASSSSQMTSPSGGPLHPLPSGLVSGGSLQSPPTSPQSSSRSFRRRSNSSSIHTSGLPPYSSRRSTQDSLTGLSERSTYPSSQPSHIPPWAYSGHPDAEENISASPHSSPPSQRRRLDPLYIHERATSRENSRYGTHSRQRAASTSSTEEYRVIPAWHHNPIGTRFGSYDDAMFPSRGGAGAGGGSSAFPNDLANLRITSSDAWRGAHHTSVPLGPAILYPKTNSQRNHGFSPPLPPPLPLLPSHMSSSSSARPPYDSYTYPPPLPPPPWVSASPSSVGSPNLPMVSPNSYTTELPAPRRGGGGGNGGGNIVVGRNDGSGGGGGSSTGGASGSDTPTENGRYACSHCSKRFARPSSLRIHIHSHTGEKPFDCELCGRGFSVQSNLRRHLKIHRTAAGGSGSGSGGSGSGTGGGGGGGGGGADNGSAEENRAEDDDGNVDEIEGEGEDEVEGEEEREGEAKREAVGEGESIIPSPSAGSNATADER